jgi:oligopeptide transport system substrate-binding protein
MGGIPTSFGYWVRRRRMALDLTRDALARRVGCSPSALKKIERDERRPSRTMATKLAEALGLSLDQRDRFVAAGLGEVSAERLVGAVPYGDVGLAPAWLVRSRAAEQGRVVGRDAEFAWLQSHLSVALEGRGRVVFVSGEAGIGKTALLTGFAHHACDVVPDLVVARGAGTTLGGLGDPYFPVRDAFRMLVADRQPPLQADQLAGEQARRLWDFAATVARTVVDSGPRMLDVLVSAEMVSERLGMGVVAPAIADAVQSDVSDEVAGVLQALSERRPLLVMLDDMQWADTTSAELLFHLTRALTDARVLVVCAYRGSEVAGASGQAAAVLRKSALESGRDIGESILDLDAIDAAAERALCDALLDLDVPDLDESLREVLYRRTRGHPLLVRELIRELKARGDLVRVMTDSWAARPGVNWDHVPARVAAVIKQRLDRLSPEERALLTAAAVEGEYFTAEVAARVAGVNVWDAHRLLTERLSRVHGLVREDTVERSGGHSLTRYRFGHALFHSFLRDRLGEGARAHAHGLVAAGLEALHSDNLELVVPQLAHHYAQAGDADRAVPYLIQTGDRARLLQAHDEAVAAYDRAVELLRERGDTERLAGTLMRIGLTNQTAFDHESAQQAFDQAFALWPTADDRNSEGASGSATLRLVSAEPKSLDPQPSDDYPPLGPVLFSGLVRFDEAANVVPDVADRWEISSDGRRYTFHLRDDVVWSDGQKVTAHDFVSAYRRALDPATGAEIESLLLAPVAGSRDVPEASVPAERVGVHAVDDRTLVIVLAESTSYFMYNLANGVLLPIPRHVVEVHGRDWCRPETIVSNGPFLLGSWASGRSLTLVRNPHYHGLASGNVQQISLKITAPWDSSHEQLYLADEVDVLANSWATTVGIIDRLRRRFPHEYVRRTEGFLTFFYWVDPHVPPLDDRRLRQAMAMAVDRDALAAEWCLSDAAVGGFVPPGIPGHVPGIAASHDADRAAQLVADVVGTDALPLPVIGLKGAEPLVHRLADQWRAVGLRVDVQVSASLSELSRAWSRTSGPKVGVSGWIADYPDPDTFLRVAVEDSHPDWRHDRYSSLLAKAARSHNPAGRLELYREAEQILAEEAVLVPLVYQAEYLMLKPWVTRFPTVPFFYPGFLKDVVIGPQDLNQVKR